MEAQPVDFGEASEAETTLPLVSDKVRPPPPCAEGRKLPSAWGLRGLVMVLVVGSVIVLVHNVRSRATALSGLSMKHPMSKMVQTTSPLASSWRIDPTQPFLVFPGRPIFDLGDGDVDIQEFNTFDGYTMTSDSSSGRAKDVANEMALDGEGEGWGSYAFSAAADASLQSVSKSEYKQFRMDEIVKWQHGKKTFASMYPLDYLRSDVKKCLKEKSVEDIEALLGHFYARELVVGGLLQKTFTTIFRSTDSEESLTTSLTASGTVLEAMASSSVAHTARVSRTVEDRQVYSKMSVYGGDTKIWVSGTKDHYEDIRKDWADSVTDDNEFPIDFTLVPLWELLDHDDMDKEKSKKLKDYMVGKWKTAQDAIPKYGVSDKQKEVVEPLGPGEMECSEPPDAPGTLCCSACGPKGECDWACSAA